MTSISKRGQTSGTLVDVKKYLATDNTAKWVFTWQIGKKNVSLTLTRDSSIAPGWYLANILINFGISLPEPISSTDELIELYHHNRSLIAHTSIPLIVTKAGNIVQEVTPTTKVLSQTRNITAQKKNQRARNTTQSKSNFTSTGALLTKGEKSHRDETMRVAVRSLHNKPKSKKTPSDNFFVHKPQPAEALRLPKPAVTKKKKIIRKKSIGDIDNNSTIVHGKTKFDIMHERWLDRISKLDTGRRSKKSHRRHMLARAKTVNHKMQQKHNTPQKRSGYLGNFRIIKRRQT